MTTKNVFGNDKYAGYNQYIILEIDGVKKLLKNGTWGQFVVDEEDNIIPIGRLKQSKTFPDTVMGMVEVGDKVEVLDKAHTLKVAADSITFDLPVGTILGNGVTFSKYDEKGNRSASLTKSAQEKYL